MKSYLLILDEKLRKQIKIWSARAGLSIKDFLIEAAKEKAKKEGLE